jgi:hypothetical protein
VLLLGEDEVARGVAIFREMSSGAQTELPLDRVADEVPARIRPPVGGAAGAAR